MDVEIVEVELDKKGGAALDNGGFKTDNGRRAV